MKKSGFYTFILGLTFLFHYACFGQNEFGQKTITGGVSHSLFRGIHKIKYREYDPSFSWAPGFQLHADFAILRRFSAGFGGTFHRHRLNVNNYSYSIGSDFVTENFVETIDVFAGYGRCLIHIKEVYDSSIDEIDLYWGGQVMFISYQLSNTSTDPALMGDSFTLDEIYAAVAGVRYYPTENFGIQAEVALPGPYTLSIGAAFRFGGRDRFFRR